MRCFRWSHVAAPDSSLRASSHVLPLSVKPAARQQSPLASLYSMVHYFASTVRPPTFRFLLNMLAMSYRPRFFSGPSSTHAWMSSARDRVGPSEGCAGGISFAASRRQMVRVETPSLLATCSTDNRSGGSASSFVVQARSRPSRTRLSQGVIDGDAAKLM